MQQGDNSNLSEDEILSIVEPIMDSSLAPVGDLVMVAIEPKVFGGTYRSQTKKLLELFGNKKLHTN